MEVTRLPLSGLSLVKPSVFRDARGFFFESYNQSKYAEHGIDCAFVQDNHSHSSNGTLRGLHYQSRPGQAKLVRVVSGRIYDVAVDIRPGSESFGHWHAVTLDAEEHAQLFVPVGFAHGFCVLSEAADVLYKVSSVYQADTECTLAWNDPDLGINWPVDDPLVSRRDQQGEAFSEFRRRVKA